MVRDTCLSPKISYSYCLVSYLLLACVVCLVSRLVNWALLVLHRLRLLYFILENWKRPNSPPSWSINPYSWDSCVDGAPWSWDCPISSAMSSPLPATVSWTKSLVLSDEPWPSEGPACNDGYCTSIVPIVLHPQRAAARRNLRASRCSWTL